MTLFNSLPVVQLWTGERELYSDALMVYLQQLLGSCKGCSNCLKCYAIKTFCSEQVIWLTPEQNGYTKEMIEHHLQPLSFALDTCERKALVIIDADRLLPGAAHILLKPLEEPPPGWSIILTTSKPDLLLPTIRSRCIERRTEYIDPIEIILPASLHWFIKPERSGWSSAIVSIDDAPSTVADTLRYLDLLVLSWKRLLHDHTDERALAVLVVFEQAYGLVPAQGNTLFFWRLLCISVYNIIYII